ncbi:MAG: PrgI family protein, partial [Streptosporangiaceae bacterium]
MTGPVRIPADVDREDAILAGLTARQVAALAVTAIVLYAGWGLVGAVVPVAVYLGGAVPVGLTVAGLVTVRRDGLSLDRLLLAAVRQRLAPQRQCAVPAAAAQVPGWLAPLVADGAPAAGPLMLPARGVDEAGVIDLGREGLAVIAAASTATFSLRTPAEQDALVAAFGSYLHSLSAPVQILIRAQRLDLTGQI